MAYDQAAILGVSISFPVFGFLLVVLRFWMRRRFQNQSIGIDDWTILFASFLVIGMGINFICGYYLGTMGMDGQPVVEDRKARQAKIDYAVLVFEKPAYGAIKLSVLFFYRRIFTVPRFRAINNWLISLIVVWTTAFFLGDILNCGAHPEANWNPAVKAKTHCSNLFIMLLIFAITDVLTDIAIMWMPYPQIKKLHMDAKERWALAGVFLLGTIDLFIGIVRLGFIVANQTVPAVNTHYNPPESTAPTFWTVTEVSIGVIAANLPALAPLFKHRARLGSSLSSFRKRLLSRSTRNDSARDLTATVVNKKAYYDDQAHNASMYEVAQKPRSESVGMWAQFERVDSLNVEEQGRNRAESAVSLA